MPERRTFRETVEALKASAKPLRGSVKLSRALESFEVDVTDAICLDVGSSTGGFTKALLDRGAKRVYAVDAGHGQLLGSLRQDPRVVNLEATNVAAVDQSLVPDVIDVVTVDVSYLSLRDAVAQLDRVHMSQSVKLIGLVKPMFELKLSGAPTDPASLSDAIAAARTGIEASGWVVETAIRSAVRGAAGAIEGWIFARR